jgi:hypothetical protein
MLDTLFDAASGRVALVAFAVLFVATLVISFVNPKNKIRKDLKCDYVATDSTFLYKIEDVTKMLGQYKPEHYEAHESFILVYDLVYPLCYAIPSVLILAYFFPALFPGSRGWTRLLVLLPLAAMFFDYAENFTMLAFLRNYRENPATPLKLLELSRLFTVVKLSLLLVSMLILFGFGARGLARLRDSVLK